MKRLFCLWRGVSVSTAPAFRGAKGRKVWKVASSRGEVVVDTMDSVVDLGVRKVTEGVKSVSRTAVTGMNHSCSVEVAVGSSVSVVAISVVDVAVVVEVEVVIVVVVAMEMVEVNVVVIEVVVVVVVLVVVLVVVPGCTIVSPQELLHSQSPYLCWKVMGEQRGLTADTAA